jgi:hypothetical protein
MYLRGTRLPVEMIHAQGLQAYTGLSVQAVCVISPVPFVPEINQ